MKTPVSLQLQSGFERLPALFDRDDFSRMIHAIDTCKEYPRDIYWNGWMKARDKAILATLWYLGLRPKEACSLRYDDFLPKHMAFIIRGENNHSHKDRILPIPKNLIPYLEDWLRYGKKSEYLYPSYGNRAQPLSSQRWKAIMRECILKPAGLWIAPVNSTMPRTRSYSLRASFATRMLEKTHDPIKTGVALGHSDWRSLNHYIHLQHLENGALDDIRKAMEE